MSQCIVDPLKESQRCRGRRATKEPEIDTPSATLRDRDLQRSLREGDSGKVGTPRLSGSRWRQAGNQSTSCITDMGARLGQRQSTLTRRRCLA